MEKTYTLEQLKDETIPLPPGYMRDWRGGSEGARKREPEPDVTYMIPYEDKRRNKQ
jgi:hypothetical protein